MLSGVASDREVLALAERFSTGELTRMMGVIRQTAIGFSRSTSRRMDAELCIVSLCQPELELDMEALNARLTRMEEQLQSGSIPVRSEPPLPVEEPVEEFPPVPEEWEAPPAPRMEPAADETPVGFWTDLSMELRKALKPPAMGFFTPGGPISCKVQGDTLTLICDTDFTAQVINKADVLEVIARKASAKLGRVVFVKVQDKNAQHSNSEQMEQLLRFGRDHSGIINIK